jgi:hypothetical protein
MLWAEADWIREAAHTTTGVQADLTVSWTIYAIGHFGSCRRSIMEVQYQRRMSSIFMTEK